MNTEEFFNLFLIVSAIYGFAFSTYIFLTKHIKNRSLVFLTLMMLFISLNNFQSWLIATNTIQDKFTVSYFEFPWHFLPAPFFYTFLIYYLGIEKKSLRLLKNIIPFFFILCFIQICLVLYCNETTTKKEFNTIVEGYRFIEEIFSFFVSISIYCYSLFIFKKREHLFPKLLTFDNLKWINNFFKITFILYLCWIIALVMKFHLKLTNMLYCYYPLRVLTTLVVFILGYQAIRQIRILKERKILRKNISEQPETINATFEIVDTKASKSKQEFEKIDNFIKSNKKFLIPKYSLHTLSKEINLGTSKLSSVINTNAKKSFIDYINEMRVEQAKEILIDSKYDNYTIVAIGLESGFNSKSTFYSVFKKHTGLTPLQYKDSKNQQIISQNT